MKTCSIAFLAALLATPALASAQMSPATHAMGHESTDHDQTEHPAMDHGAKSKTATDAAPMNDAHMDHSATRMSGALGPYPITREGSGTSWQPDTSVHGGLSVMKGDSTLMGHALLNGVYDWQEGPRGDQKAFVSGMIMGLARRDFGGDVLQLRAMFSPEPLMGKSGFPVLLASGETANGKDTLVDRQHPHDLFMELSASYSHALTDHDSVFVYGGLPGEPAFGPPAYMHRLSIMDSPEPPISHHWLDSTHIVFGVVTAGYVHGDWKFEASRFHGREPDQFRYDFDAGTLDSTALRLSWNPNREWSFQVSWADVTSPEQLAPDEDQKKWSASAIMTRPIGGSGWWSTTLAWGRRINEHDSLDAYVVETAVHPNDAWTLFGRAERVDNDELLATEGSPHGPVFTVGKASIGAIRDFDASRHIKLGVGALYAFSFIPISIEDVYGGDVLNGAMVFLRVKIE